MECPKCRFANPQGARFCAACGTALSTACAHCGATCEPGARFCSACGKPVAAAPEAQAPSEPPRHPSWGEVKPATILFADVAGSTEQIAALDPEQAMQRLQPAIERMVAVVEGQGGTVLRTLGDGIMALFGVPVAMEHHAEGACRAALALQREFPARAGGLVLRVGLHSGKVASDPTEAGDRRGGGAHGVAIHLASRVAALAEGGQTLLTDDVRAQLRPGRFTVQAAGAWHLKGITQPVDLFALRGEASGAVQPWSAHAGASPFVGREPEMQRLQQAFDRCAQGHGQIVGLVGDAGVGKSRVCAEFAGRCEAAGASVLWVRSHTLGHALPLLPVRELLGPLYFGWRPGMDAAAQRARMDAALKQAGQTGRADAALVHELMGVADTASGVVPLPGRDLRQARLLAALRALVRAQAAESRLIVVEDLHWLDESSLPLLSAMAEAMDGTRTLLLLNYRPGFEARWFQWPHAAELAVEPLAEPDVRALVTASLGAVGHAGMAQVTPERAAWVDRIAERSQGNPLFAEELARHLLRGDPGAEAQDLPDRIDALIGAQVDALGDRDKTVLQACAVMGKELDVAVLARVLRLPRGQLAAALRALESAAFLQRESTTGGRAQLGFRHPLMQEVVYGAQLRSRREVVHASVAETMERRYGDSERAGELASLVAHHWEQAGQPVRAARQAALAARWLRSGDSALAIQRWRKVLSLLHAAYGDDEVKDLRALAAARIVGLGWLGRMPLDELPGLMALTRVPSLDPRMPQLLRIAAARMHHANGGAADEYVTALQEAVALPDPPGDPGRPAILQSALCQAYGWAGLLRESLQASDIALAHLDRASTFDRDFIAIDLDVWCLTLRIRTLARMGKFDEANTWVARVARSVRADMHPMVRYLYVGTKLELGYYAGEMATLDEAAEQVQGYLKNAHNPYMKVAAGYMLGLGCSARREFAMALLRLTEALRLLREGNIAPEFESELLSVMARVQFDSGDSSTASATALDALEVAKSQNNRVAACRAVLVLAAAQDRGGQGSELPAPPASVTCWRELADDLLDETGALALVHA